MAISASTAFEVRTTGSDANSGGFVAGASGTDYSQQDAAQYSGTDLAVDGTTNTKVTSVAHSFVAADVGNILRITAGTGFTTGAYQIVSVTAGAATLDRSPAAVSTTGGSYVVGGSLASPGLAASFLVTGNTLWIKSGTYTVSSASANVSGGCVSLSGGASLYVEGYGSTRGDLGTRPTIVASGISTFTLLLATTFTESIIRNLILDGASLTGSQGLKIGRNLAELIHVQNCKNNGILGFSSAAVFVRCSVTGCSTQPAISTNGLYLGCVAYANSVTGFACVSAAYLFHCISSGNTGATSDGFSITTTLQCVNCVAYGNGRNGFLLSGNVMMMLENCIAEANTGVGYSASSNGAFLHLCAAYNNTGGNVSISGARTENTGAITGSSSFFTNAAGNDFSLNRTASAGASVRAAGFPGVFPGLSTTGYIDIGAAQHADPSVISLSRMFAGF